MSKLMEDIRGAFAPPPGTLRVGEYHPMAPDALKYINDLPLEEKCVLAESFASCALSGNRMAEICSETLRRVMHGEPVSDRYVLGLAWAIRDMGRAAECTEMMNNQVRL